MVVFGVILMVLAIIGLIVGFVMGITAPGGTTINFGLLIDRQNVLIVSGFVLITGAVFTVGGELLDHIRNLANREDHRALVAGVEEMADRMKKIKVTRSKERSRSPTHDELGRPIR